MQEKALYILANFDEETQKTLAGYYDILQQSGFSGSQTRDIPYHFTLGSKNIKEEIDLERICEDTPCIEINLAHIGIFRH